VEHDAADTAVFRWTVRVYYEDTDAGGIVYYANYLKFFERCRTEWLRSLGIDQRALAEQQRLQFVVAEMSTRYLQPARLDDTLIVDLSIAERARSWLVFRQQAWRGAGLLATAQVKVACVDAARLAAVRLPARLLERLDAPRAAAH
jgi:acyl-CoA thioester hydrolase